MALWINSAINPRDTAAFTVSAIRDEAARRGENTTRARSLGSPSDDRDLRIRSSPAVFGTA